jgi:hypothetical protein
MDIAVLAQLLSSLATFVVAAGILYQGREARKARDDEDRPQIIVDADYTGRFTTNIVVRNIGHGIARNITFEFSAPLQSTSGHDITELPYFRNGINFMAPQTDLPADWDSYQNVVRNLREKGLTEGITIVSKYEDRQGGTLRDRVDDQSSPVRRERVLRVQGLRGRGAGPGGSGQGPGGDLRRRQRSQRSGKPTTRRASKVENPGQTGSAGFAPRVG